MPSNRPSRRHVRLPEPPRRSLLQLHLRAQREAAAAALERLTAALALVDVVLPSAGLDGQSPYTGTVLVHLGNARAETVERLAEAVTRGAARAGD